MVLLHQLLVTRLETRKRQRRCEIENGERLFLFGPRPLARGLARRPLVEIEQAVVAPVRLETRPDAAPERPSRALPHRVVTDLRLDFRLVHSGVVIPGGIVLTHVIQAKPVEPLQVRTRSRRAKIAAPRAAGMVARPQ